MTESACIALRWLKQSGQIEEAPIINFMRSAAADPQERFESQEVPQTAMAEYDQGPEEVEDAEEGGYRLTFSTSSMCFAGTNAQVLIYQHSNSCCYAGMNAAMNMSSVGKTISSCNLSISPEAGNELAVNKLLCLISHSVTLSIRLKLELLLQWFRF